MLDGNKGVLDNKGEKNSKLEDKAVEALEKKMYIKRNKRIGIGHWWAVRQLQVTNRHVNEASVG